MAFTSTMALASKSALRGPVLAGKGVRPAVAKRMGLVCRAEEESKAVAKVDRSKDSLFFASESSLQYLDGTLPADFGFDPLGLLDPVNSGGFITPEWLKYSEVIHCRWAMLGAAGCIAPEVLAAGQPNFPEVTNVVWFRSGVIPPAGTYGGYWLDPYALFLIEAVAMNFAELKRLQDFRYPGSQGKHYFLGLEAAFKGSGDPAYPGGPFFNLFNLGKTPQEIKELRTKEIKNGRLAMIAMWGYGAQAILTGKGPFQNLVDHISNPFDENILTNFAKVYGGL